MQKPAVKKDTRKDIERMPDETTNEEQQQRDAKEATGSKCDQSGCNEPKREHKKGVVVAPTPDFVKKEG